MDLTQTSKEAIEELNARFREHGIGYEFRDGELWRVDSTYIHSQAVKPALALLNGAGPGFAGPLQEFLEAHREYRHGKSKEAIAAALKSFESTLKSICTARSWAYDPDKHTAKDLLDIVFREDLVPSYLQSHFGGLRAVMESGVPTPSHRTSRHGQGPTPVEVPEHVARYVLHLAASNIVFLIESHKAKK